VVLIEGEPGIGESRFLAEVLADPAGCRPFRADADELERTRPFGPLADALGCRPASPDQLSAEIARLIDEGPAEFRIVERFAELLERLALERPLLLAIDDLQWADPSTATALRFATRHLVDVPVSFVLASRPLPRGHELAGFVDASLRDGALQVTLGPLDDDAVAGLVQDILGRPPGAGLRSLVASAAGSPFYVTELVEALAADGQLHTHDGIIDANTASVPVAFRGSVLRYLRFLGESRLSLLRWAAVLGSHFSPDALATVSGEAIDVVLQIMDEAIRSGIVVHDDDRLAFRHDLLHEALYEDMGTAAQRSRHLAAGRALATGGATPREVAYHFMRAPATEDATAVDWLRAAASHAFDATTQAELLESALQRLAPTDPRAAEIGHQAIIRLGRVGRVTDAEALAERLRAHVGAAGTARLSAALAGAYADQTHPEGVLRHCDALRHDRSLPPDLRANLHAYEGSALRQVGRVDEAEAAARRAIEAGERQAAPFAVLTGRSVLCLCALATGRGRDAAAMAAANAKTWESDYGTVILQMTLLNEDRLADVDELYRTSQRRMVDSGYLVALPALQANSGLALLAAGKLDDALVQAEAAYALAEQMKVPVTTGVARGMIARIALHHGSVAEADAALGPTPPVSGLGMDGIRSRALVLEAQDDLTAARETLIAIWDSQLRYTAGGWIGVGPHLVPLHLAAGDRDQAAAVTTGVERGASGSDAPSAAGAALRCRALVERDPALMQQAIARYEHGPRVLDTAATREDAAAARRDRRRRAAARRPGRLRGRRRHRRRHPGASLPAQTRTTPRRKGRPPATRDRLGQPHPHRATGRHPRRPRPHQPPDRRPALHLHLHRRHTPPPHLPEAWHQLPPPARGPDETPPAGHRVTQPAPLLSDPGMCGRPPGFPGTTNGGPPALRRPRQKLVPERAGGRWAAVPPNAGTAIISLGISCRPRGAAPPGGRRSRAARSAPSSPLPPPPSVEPVAAVTPGWHEEPLGRYNGPALPRRVAVDRSPRPEAPVAGTSRLAGPRRGCCQIGMAPRERRAQPGPPTAGSVAPFGPLRAPGTIPSMNAAACRHDRTGEPPMDLATASV
jgi:tetratricopeptide (TPR) repeat protein